MEAIAKAKHLRGSAQKARLVIDTIRGKNVSQALAILQFTNKRAADPIEKCLRSAIANAESKAGEANVLVDVDDLWVKECFVDIGPTKRRFRFRPAPQGRAYRERRHYCHVTILVSSDEREDKGSKKTSAPTKSVKAKRGGAAAAAPRAKTVKIEDKVEEPIVETTAVETDAAELTATENIAVENVATENTVDEVVAETTATEATETENTKSEE